MRCVILQPSYIPWRGYFHQIQKADVFVFYDDVQYDKHGWRNRNRVKTPNGTQWLTIPVLAKGNVSKGMPINAARINPSTGWARKHWLTLSQSYHRAPFFDRHATVLENLYKQEWDRLADCTIAFTIALAKELGIAHTRYVRSSELGVAGSKTARLVGILQAVGATHYISGPSARQYLDEAALGAAGISVEYMAYDYPEYEQLYPPFDPHVSIVDLLFMKGSQATDFVWSER